MLVGMGTAIRSSIVINAVTAYVRPRRCVSLDLRIVVDDSQEAAIRFRFSHGNNVVTIYLPPIENLNGKTIF